MYEILKVELDLWHWEWNELRYHLLKKFVPAVKSIGKDLFVQSARIDGSCLKEEIVQTSREVSFKENSQETNMWKIATEIKEEQAENGQSRRHI